MKPAGNVYRPEEGGVLLGVMLLTMMLAAISVTLTLSGQTELLIARSDETAAQAHAAAEAGLNHAVDLTLTHLNGWQANGFASQGGAITSLLEGPDGTVGTPEADADNGSLEGLGLPRPPATVPINGLFGVSYAARVYDEDDPARGTTLSSEDTDRIGENGIATSDANSGLVIQATGYGPSAAVVTLEATLGAASVPGFLVDGSIDIGGNTTVNGANGSIHANGDLSLSGSTEVTGSATASGQYDESGNPDVGGVSGGGFATLAVPVVQPDDYRPLADVIMTTNGLVTDQGGTTLCDASSDSDACEDEYGWTFRGAAGWEYTDRSHQGGTFYIESDAELSERQGSAANPIPLTVIAEGSIDVSGRPHTTAAASDQALVAGGDLQFRGGSNYRLEGQFLAHEQLKIQGGVELVGQIVVEDEVSGHGLVTENQISGSALITVSGGSGGGLGVTAWREVR